MDGLLIIDKPEGITSHDVINRVRRVFGTRRIGHTGTLDPFATGVLLVLVGRATRLAQFLDRSEKEYVAVAAFGFETDTGDRTGSPIREDRESGPELVDAAAVDWQSVAERFCGASEQIPPMYSAKKIAGKKLYELARENREIERKAEPIFVSDLEYLGPAGAGEHRFRIICSAGTYIRTLAADMARAAGTRAHLSELRRTRAGSFGISQAVGLDELAAAADPGERLITMAEAVGHLPSVTLSPERIERTRSGLASRLDISVAEPGQAFRMLDSSGELAAVGIFDAAENAVRPKVVLL